MLVFIFCIISNRTFEILRQYIAIIFPMSSAKKCGWALKMNVINLSYNFSASSSLSYRLSICNHKSVRHGNKTWTRGIKLINDKQICICIFEMLVLFLDTYIFKDYLTTDQLKKWLMNIYSTFWGRSNLLRVLRSLLLLKLPALTYNILVFTIIPVQEPFKWHQQQ